MRRALRRIILLSFACACSTDPEPSGRATNQQGDASVNGPGDGGTTTDGSPVTGEDARAPDAAAVAAGELFGFVGSSTGKIRVYAVDAATGGWTFKKESSAGANPSFLAFDPAHRRIVATDEAANGLVRSFSFDAASGALVESNSKPAGGAGSTHVSFDATGKWVMVANYTGGNMSILPIDTTTGMLGNASDTKSSGAMTHWAGTNPSNTHVFVPAVGANVVAQYTLNSLTGKLTDNGTASPPANAGPRHLVFHPSETWAYVINEVAITVTTFDFDKNTGKLTSKQTISALPPNPAGGASGAEIFVHPSGKHVYASTRTFNSIAQFAVNPTDGKLTLVENVATGGNRPRSFGIDPEGTLLFAGNQDLNQVVGFKIDAATGKLTSLGKTVDVTGPTFVGLARMP